MYTSLRFLHLRTDEDRVVFSTLRTLGWQMSLLFLDRFLYELSQIPEFSSRIHCFIFQSKFTDAVASIQCKTEIILHVCKVQRHFSKGSDLRYYQTFDKVSMLAFLTVKNSPSGSCRLFKWGLSACFVSNISVMKSDKCTNKWWCVLVSVGERQCEGGDRTGACSGKLHEWRQQSSRTGRRLRAWDSS